ncbi:hypothetical protein MTR_0433s0050 [Medicago truncatula]|uniref:Uncharacterized protein n=1 Tax=Medicago truncatula TaxID=3880 RepID=A0A072TFF4_MEDTR|nr:hypothetical protein MTR_0433s0050 [Medicago truncatula]
MGCKIGPKRRGCVKSHNWQKIGEKNIIDVSMRSMKRKFEELMSVNLLAPSNHRGRPRLEFYDSELPGGASNSAIPLLVRHRWPILIKILQLTEKNLSPYVGNELYGFNGSSTQPWGYIELLVTFSEKEAKKTIKVSFLVIDCPSLYNCIIGRTELAQLGAVCSTGHLKLKYHAKNGIIASLNGDIEAAKRCFLQGKLLRALWMPIWSNLIPSSLRKTLRNKNGKRRIRSMRNFLDIFLSVNSSWSLSETTPRKNFKIGKDLPELVRAQLVAYLRENADLFAWSAADMPIIDPSVACHQLTVDPGVSAIAQRRRKQSPEKSEAADKAVKDLLEENFISEAKYTTWACPKDAYPLPNIDKLVDNSSGFKLLSFMDAYFGYNQIPMDEEDKMKIVTPRFPNIKISHK